MISKFKENIKIVKIDAPTHLHLQIIFYWISCTNKSYLPSFTIEYIYKFDIQALSKEMQIIQTNRYVEHAIYYSIAWEQRCPQKVLVGFSITWKICCKISKRVLKRKNFDNFELSPPGLRLSDHHCFRLFFLYNKFWMDLTSNNKSFNLSQTLSYVYCICGSIGNFSFNLIMNSFKIV
jgi:hypothetical protein